MKLLARHERRAHLNENRLVIPADALEHRLVRTRF
jgi:hypothetical protein